MNRLIVSIGCCLILNFIGCGKNNKADIKAAPESELKQLAQEQDLRKVKLKIDGMTCQIGCANHIQLKLSKAKGVENARVSFESKGAELRFDANQITEKEIVSIVNALGDGNMYEVISIEKAE